MRLHPDKHSYDEKLKELSTRAFTQAQEIYHGRAAMIGITGFAVQEFITGQPIVDQTSLFFTPFWEILAPGLASSLAQDLGF